MIRFIDIRNQGTGERFAFYDTITDRFIEVDGVMAWENLEDFRFNCGNDTGLFQRCSCLCPEWVNDVNDIG